jgi:hypothetical protein
VVPEIAGTLNGWVRLIAASPWGHGGGTVQQEGTKEGGRKRGEERGYELLLDFSRYLSL